MKKKRHCHSVKQGRRIRREILFAEHVIKIIENLSCFNNYSLIWRVRHFKFNCCLWLILIHFWKEVLLFSLYWWDGGGVAGSSPCLRSPTRTWQGQDLDPDPSDQPPTSRKCPLACHSVSSTGCIFQQYITLRLVISNSFKRKILILYLKFIIFFISEIQNFSSFRTQLNSISSWKIFQ